jgi:hypothetical protein
LWNVVGANVNVGPSDDQEHTSGRTGDEAAGGFEDGDTGAFRTYQRSRYVEAVFREQVVEVVSRDSAGDVGELAADVVSVTVGDLL